MGVCLTPSLVAVLLDGRFEQLVGGPRYRPKPCLPPLLP